MFHIGCYCAQMRLHNILIHYYSFNSVYYFVQQFMTMQNLLYMHDLLNHLLLIQRTNTVSA